MPQIYVCFLWHMHQPFYKDLVTGEYRLPWTRMHALKDYYGMVKILEEFPNVHLTFNLVPSLLAQIEEYAEGKAVEPFLSAALQPAEELGRAGQEFLLNHFFQAHPSRMIGRYPRYAELHQAWNNAGHSWAGARHTFDTQAYRDLQVLSQLAWFDEEYQTGDSLIRELVGKGRGYSLADQKALGRKQTEVIGNVIPIYRDTANRGQIELTTTPYYHPILPLVCDTNIAEVSHPYQPLPSRFAYPQDAREHLARSLDFMERRFGSRPAGLWPSEGSVSDEALRLAADCGFRWFAGDNGVLARTLNTEASPDITYRPWRWRSDGREMFGVFRDHQLSDLIGFVYNRMEAEEAAIHFLDAIRENCRSILASGRDALVPIFLDGENAWEYYHESGRPFLRELYRRISEDRTMEALTVSEAIERVEARDLNGLVPGSWIDANFDIWIGHDEDNVAWEYLLAARTAFDRALAQERHTLTDQQISMAKEELLIAEGSDWCWWYGPQHDSPNRPEFDRLYRDHLSNVYTFLGQTPPPELSKPILRVTEQAFHQPPSGPVQPTLDGEVTSHFEWLGAGIYRLDTRRGAMHGHHFFVQELRYGSDGQHLFLRLDFVEGAPTDAATELHVVVSEQASGKEPSERIVKLNGQGDSVTAVYNKVCEAKLSLKAIGIATGRNIRFRLSLWHDGLPVEALPADGWIDLATAEPAEWTN